MSVNKAIYKPLFTELSTSTESSMFFVNPGEIAQVMAFGFAKTASKADNTTRTVIQAAHLEQVLLTEEFKPSTMEKNGCCCPILYNLSDFRETILAYEPVRKCGQCIMMCRGDNMMLINTPGLYRFVLNDVNALGIVRMYIRMFTRDEFPWDSKFFIGE